MLTVSRTLTHSLSSLSAFSFFGTQQQPLSITHTHSLTHPVDNPAVCGCSSLDMPDRLLWGGRWVTPSWWVMWCLFGSIDLL